MEFFSTVDSNPEKGITHVDVTFLLKRFFWKNEWNYAQTSGKWCNPDIMQIYHLKLCQQITSVSSMHWKNSIWLFSSPRNFWGWAHFRWKNMHLLWPFKKGRSWHLTEVSWCNRTWNTSMSVSPLLHHRNWTPCRCYRNLHGSTKRWRNSCPIQYPKLALYVVEVQRCISTFMGESKEVHFGFSNYLHDRKSVQTHLAYEHNMAKPMEGNS